MANLCEVCALNKAEVVDHDHNTGLFRGFLCKKCNIGLGLLGDTLDSLLQAVVYLESQNE